MRIEVRFFFGGGSTHESKNKLVKNGNTNIVLFTQLFMYVGPVYYSIHKTFSSRNR